MTGMTKYQIPTGYLFVDDYSRGRLETLSIGDYGKPFNVKADFLGYSRPIAGVPNTHCMPLSEKWVVTLSTQYGCRMRCTFCDVPKVQWRGNATEADLAKQLHSAISLFSSVRYTERLNIHFARMGEPIFNQAVLDFAVNLHRTKGTGFLEETGLRVEVLHPVLTTSLPANFSPLCDRILRWCDIKNHIYNGQAGLQFSINSTNEHQRERMFSGMSLTLVDFGKIAEKMPPPISRKYCLNFAFSTDFEIDAAMLSALFDRNKFMVKITPIHNNNACIENGIATKGGYTSFDPYRQVEENLIAAGYDVLVFVPSMDEENGLVTCGNAILGGSKLAVEHSSMKINGVPEGRTS